MSRRSVRIHGGDDNNGNPPSDDIAHVDAGAIHVQLVDPSTGTVAKIDPSTGFLVTADHNLNAIHAGRHWTYSSIDTAVASAGVVEILIRVPVGTLAHIHFTGAVSVDMKGELFEAPTTTADGTPLTPVARNRNSITAPNTLLFGAPTVTVDGTLLTVIFMPGGSGKSSAGGTGESVDEGILPAGDYLTRVTNLTNTSNTIAQVSFEWHEEAV